MLEWCVCGIRCRVSLLFPALVTALLLSQPDGLAVSCLLASLIHEGGHLLAMVAAGVPPRACTLGAFGMRMNIDNQLVNYKKNLLISLAGPLTNGVVAVILFWLHAYDAAMVHLVLAVLNLLPTAALDGGEILRCGLCLMGLDRCTRWALRLSSVLVLLPLAAISGWLFVQEKNWTLLIVSAYLVVMVFFSEKYEKTS